MVHQRAGLSALNDMEQDELDEAIFQERGWEFIGEAKLYYDELRTDRLGKRLKEFMKRGVAEGMYLFKNYNLFLKRIFYGKFHKVIWIPILLWSKILITYQLR